jgi:signal transduction histidine kinase/PleD family two-component response regulator
MNDHKIKILLVEDNPGDARLILETLKESKTDEFVLTQAETLGEGLRHLHKESFDILLLDLGLPDSSGIETLLKVQAETSEVPIVVMTGLSDESIALKALQMGAQDYLVKGRVEGNLVTRAVRYAIERKKSERALLESEQKSRTLVENITDGIIMIDRDSNISVMNPAAQEMLNTKGSVSDLDTKTLQDILGIDFIQLQDSLSQGKESNVKKEIGIGDLTYKELVSPIKGESKHLNGLVISLQDITQEKRLDNLKSEFISVVSHELRTPLCCIKNAMDLLLCHKAGETNEQQDKFLSMASRNVDRLARIINDFLDLSRMEAGKLRLRFEKVDLSEIVEGTFSTFALSAQKKSIKLEKNISPDIPIILGDHDKLSQVLTNLVSNAVKFTPEGGKIKIHATLIDKTKYPLPPIIFLAHDDFIKVEVEDTGPGIPDAELESIFDKFYQVERSLTRNMSGTGLGLPICKNLVEAHMGKIWVESEPGKGSKFIFVLPRLKGSEIFDYHLQSLIGRAKSATSCLSLGLLQTKYLDEIKAGMGKNTGRSVFETMVMLAQKTACKSTDHVHPDEESGRVFIIMEDTSKEGASAVCNRLKDNLLNYDFSFEGKSTQLEFSLGVATYPDDASNAQELKQAVERFEYLPYLTVRQQTVLVIDDDENFAHAITRQLTRRKHRVIEAFNGMEGIEKAMKAEPDLIVLDMLMPGMDGYQVMARLKQEEETQNIPILVLSGGIQMDVDRIIALGAKEFLTKPFSDMVFIDTIERLIIRKEVNHVYHTGSR